MRRRSHRHPALETAVFAAALLLAAFIVRELWSRRPTSSPAASGNEPIALNPGRPGLPAELEPHRTETAVTAVSAIKLSRVQPRKSKTAVPAPR